MNSRWRDVWSRPVGLDEASAQEPSLAELIVADGFNTGFGDVGPIEWMGFVDRACTTFALQAEEVLFDVGCGSGAFLYPAHQRGIAVGGIDYSASRIALARRAMPAGRFEVGEAAELAPRPTADAVISFSVFQYFSSLDYARGVIERMCSKSTRAVAIYDLPDLELADRALAERHASAGGAEAYGRRYGGLDHLSYSREWVAAVMQEQGLRDVTVEAQTMPNYGIGKFRFNAWGWTSDGQRRR